SPRVVVFLRDAGRRRRRTRIVRHPRERIRFGRGVRAGRALAVVAPRRRHRDRGGDGLRPPIQRGSGGEHRRKRRGNRKYPFGDRPMKVVSVVGARPQFIRAFPVSRALRERHEEVLVHTGQHYSETMSEVFFDELDIPTPEYNLGVGSGTHGEQTGRVVTRFGDLVAREDPDVVVVYGDTNSTIAGAIVAAKTDAQLAHVEAGLRSDNRDMPEELNRVLTDHVSDLLFAPTTRGVENLAAEG